MSRPVLETDGYKFSMAEAGWPLRQETFYYAHRAGGPQVLPVDVERYVRALLPEARHEDYAYLARNGYELGGGFKAAICAADKLRVDALPQGAIFYPGEPVFSVTGPSALVSWLEPLLLQLHFRIQVATLARFDLDALAQAVATLSCDEERQIVAETLAWSRVPPPPMRVDEAGYRARVKAVAQDLVDAVGGAGERIFEVGLRAASCSSQHLAALEACKEAGITRTSNVYGAQKLGMVPVGTMGHEHVQRYGSDEAAYRAMRDRRPERSSYLLDTYDTLNQGLPAALAIIAEDPDRGDSIRFDSGDKAAQFEFAVHRARTLAVEPVYILEDGLNAADTCRLEALRERLGVPASHVFYGYGGTLISRPSFTPLTRDRVSAIWKLSQTARTPTMKFANSPAEGKQSLPGHPVVWRRVAGDGPIGIIGQAEEAVPDGYELLTGAEHDLAALDAHAQVVRSVATRALVQALRARHFPPERPEAHPHP